MGSLLTTIDGIGSNTAARLIAELGDPADSLPSATSSLRHHAPNPRRSTWWPSASARKPGTGGRGRGQASPLLPGAGDCHPRAPRSE
ncbi:MAG: hypothetical protein EA405_00350 [Rhodospirillales bacterium]|nr:MAG: hypothetical protein EA405_00350 [Rhodospirillales bacterium]